MKTSKINQAHKTILTAIIATLATVAVVPFASAACAKAPQDATPATKQVNAAVLKELNFADREDFEDAQRGLIAAPAEMVIKDTDGHEVWNLKAFDFLKQKDAPATVNPSLWRQAQLNMNAGLFKVVDRIYQVRGLDLSNMTIVEGDKGLILIDPLITTEAARAALGLYHQHRGNRPVVAVIYTHSHVDHMTPDTEAPAEMMIYFPQFKVFDSAELACHTLHNVLTLRGAQVRDANKWSLYLNEAIDTYGNQTEALIAQHHWPLWGRDSSIQFLKNQRDMYKYIHDQTLRLANEGYTMAEIGPMLKLQPSLARQWYARDYYGTVNHDAKAVYQKYLGWYDMNPANLNPLPPEESAKNSSGTWAAPRLLSQRHAVTSGRANTAGWLR